MYHGQRDKINSFGNEVVDETPELSWPVEAAIAIKKAPEHWSIHCVAHSRTLYTKGPRSLSHGAE